jgi:hypothetical protein
VSRGPSIYDAPVGADLDRTDVVHLRLLKLGLSRPSDVDPVSTVRRLGAVQSQDYGPATWSLGQRIPGLRAADADGAFDSGELVRTHVLRPTWHFVAPRDLRWLLALTTPRVQRLNAYYYRQLGLDDRTIAASRAAIERVLADGEPRTRKQMLEAMAAVGVPVVGLAGSYALMHAELAGVVCSGPRIGRQHSYLLVEDRVPPAPPAEAALAADPDAALAELVHRFFAGHGPATVQDLRAWASLTVTDVRRGLEAVGDRLASVVVEGRTFWFEPPADPYRAPSPAVHLLQAYDEYLVGHADSKDLIVPEGDYDLWGRRRRFNGVVVLDGRVAGDWRRRITRDRVLVEVELLHPFEGAAAEALQAAADAHGRFLGNLTAELAVTAS